MEETDIIICLRKKNKEYQTSYHEAKKNIGFKKPINSVS